MAESNLNQAVSASLPNTTSIIGGLEVNVSTGNLTNMNNAASALKTYKTLNSIAVKMYGIDLLWFRKTPQKRSTDVIFQDYTLYNVEDCPISIKGMPEGGAFNDAQLTYNLMGVEYQVPMTLQLDIDTWETATSKDGTLPQKGDILYIPVANKLYMVSSMTPIRGFLEQITAYKINIEKYKPTRDTVVGENLKSTMEDHTVSIDGLFGKEISKNVSDITDKPQTDPLVGTKMDGTKKVALKEATEYDGFIRRSTVLNIISGDLIVDGHTVARSYYDMENESSPVVQYNALDTLDSSSERCLSEWLLIKDDASWYNVSSISIDGSSGGYTTMSVKSGWTPSEGTLVVLSRGNIVLYGTVTDASGSTATISVSNKVCKMVSGVPNWNSLPGYRICPDDCVNLLSSTSGISLDIVARKFIRYVCGGKTYFATLLKPLNAGEWYGIIMNFGKEFNINVFESETKLQKIYEQTMIANMRAAGSVSYYINPSRSCMTNIRLYDRYNTDIDKQLTDLVSYFAKNNSDMIINDSAAAFLSNDYIGSQR